MKIQVDFFQNLLGLGKLRIIESIPEEWVGALSLITDKSGKHYYVATQDLQALQAKPALWKKWLAFEGQLSVGEKRSQELLQFIQANGGPIIQF